MPLKRDFTMLYSPSNAQLQKLNKLRNIISLMIIIGYSGYYLCRANLSAALPFIGSDLGYSNTELGIILTISEFIYALGKLINGPLTDRLGGKNIFILGMIGTVFSNIWFSQTSSILGLTIVWCFCRYFLSMGWGGLIKIIGYWYDSSKNGTIMGIVSISFQCGSGIALLYCGLLLKLGFTWRWLFIIPAFTLAFIAIISWFVIFEKPNKIYPKIKFGSSGDKSSINYNNEEQINTLSIFKKLWSKKMFRYLLFFSFFTTMLRSMFLIWSAKFFADIGMSSSTAVMRSAIFPFLGVVGSLWLGWYTDKYKRGNRTGVMALMLIGLVICLLLTAFLVEEYSNYHITIFILTGMCGFFLYGPYSMTSGCLALDIAGPSAAGTYTGCMDCIGYSGGALAIFGVGWLSDLLGWSEVFYLLAAIASLSVLCCLLMSNFWGLEKFIFEKNPVAPVQDVL
jgi:sugar phosphate permease